MIYGYVHCPPECICILLSNLFLVVVHVHVCTCSLFLLLFFPQTTAKKPLTPELESKSFKFCLGECFKSKCSTSSEIIPTTEAFENQKATPSQFRSNPASFTKKWKVKACTADQSSSSSCTDDSSRPCTAELTVPHTSNFLTKGRSQSITVKSAVKEEEVVAQMKK